MNTSDTTRARKSEWLYALPELTKQQTRILLRRLAENGKDISRVWVIAGRNKRDGKIDRAVVMPSGHADALTDYQRTRLMLCLTPLPNTGCRPRKVGDMPTEAVAKAINDLRDEAAARLRAAERLRRDKDEKP